MTSMVLILIVQLAVFFPVRSVAAEVVPQGSPPVRLAAEKEGTLDSAHLTILSITILQHSLREVQAKLGPARIYRDYDEGHSVRRLCYTSSNESDGTTVVFESGPLGGMGETITWVSLLSGEVEFAKRSMCRHSRLVSREISTPGGLKLGLSESQVTAILGEPVEVAEARLSFKYLGRRLMTKREFERFKKAYPHITYPEFFDVSSGVEITFRDGKVISLNIYKIETY